MLIKLKNTIFIILSIIKKIVKKSKKPVIIYPVIYVILIFLFAFIYMFLPYEFYHDTAKYERSLSDDALIILNGIENNILNSQKTFNEDKIIVNDNVYIDKKTLNVHSLKFEDNNECSFNISLAVFVNSELDFSQMGYTMPFRFNLKEYIKSDDNIFLFLNLEEESLPVQDLEFEYMDIVRALFPAKHNGILVLHTDMKIQLYDKIVGLKNANNGFPSKSSGQFVRMLYFSTFTITAASQGDILPITTFARTLVAIETIIGVLIVGLFFNSLANDISGKKK